MGIILTAIILGILVLFWRAQRDRGNTFNVFDLVMDDGKASNTRIAFMTVLIVSSWIIILLTLHDKLDPMFFGAYLAAWVTPLVAKVIFGKGEPPLPEPKVT